ncbi:MAG: serine hydrolase [Verrucomicrobia subdivision 3 bacterium]|nr:serine hydrolase [Limisphaerales bacterium]
MNDLRFAFRQLLKNPGFSAVAVLTLAGFCHAEDGKPDFSSARNLIQTQMVAKSIPAFSVAVVRRGEILWEEGFGWADRENRISATEHTPYYLASVSKTFTATAVMILQERKQLDLDRPVNSYLGLDGMRSPRWDVKGATVRRVMTHTAGLTTFRRNYYPEQGERGISLGEAIRRYGIAFWPPGERFDYSNLGYAILGEMVARASSRSYEDFLRTEIFLPLGMTRASLGGAGLEKHVAKRYSSDHGLRPRIESATPGASAIYCSAHDLANFGMFHLKAHPPSHKAILSDASIDAMQISTVSTGDGLYGLGWDFHGYRSVLAQGGTDDASTWLRLVPSEGIAVVGLANTGTSLPSKVINEVLFKLLPAFREESAKRGKELQSEKPLSGLPSSELAGKWTGAIATHRGNVPLLFSFTQSGDVHAKLGAQLTTLLNEAHYAKRRLTGKMAGDLGIPDETGPASYDLEFELFLRDGVLNGAVTTDSHASPLPGPALPFWVELKKETVQP